MNPMFEVYKKEVEIETSTGKFKYIFAPLSGKHLPSLYKLMGKLAPASSGANESDILQLLDEETVSIIHSLIVETLSTSYPNESQDDLERFASQNLASLLPALIEVNLGKPKS